MINPFYSHGYLVTRPSLDTIITKGRYPTYAEEVEDLRQKRMATRLEWRRRMRRKMAANKAYTALCWYGAIVGACLALVALSEILRLTVWTVLR